MKLYHPLTIFILVILLVTGCAAKSQLMEAASKGEINTVKKLQSEGININERDKNGATALMHAIWSKKPDAAKYLIEAGTDINAKDNYGTPLIYAVDYKQHDLINILLEKGADIEATDYQGETALVHAIYSVTDFEAAKILIKKGANFKAKCIKGETALDLALGFGRGDLIHEMGFNLYKPEPGKARLIFVGTKLFDGIIVKVGEQTKRLNQLLYAGVSFFDVPTGKHDVFVYAYKASKQPILTTEVIAEKIYYFKVTQDMQRRAAHYIGVKLSNIEVTPFNEADARKEIETILQIRFVF
jgi:hypothetical protein